MRVARPGRLGGSRQRLVRFVIPISSASPSRRRTRHRRSILEVLAGYERLHRALAWHVPRRHGEVAARKALGRDNLLGGPKRADARCGAQQRSVKGTSGRGDMRFDGRDPQRRRVLTRSRSRLGRLGILRLRQRLGHTAARATRRPPVGLCKGLRLRGKRATAAGDVFRQILRPDPGSN